MKKRLTAVLLVLAFSLSNQLLFPAAQAQETSSDVETEALSGISGISSGESAELAEESKPVRENAAYDITVNVTNTDTEEKTVSLAELLGNENVPAENVVIGEKSGNGEYSSVLTSIYFEDGFLKYTAAERPADGKSGTVVYTVSSDDFEDFEITVNITTVDTREEIEDIEFEELPLDPEENAGGYYGYSLEDVAYAAFDDADELIDGFEYHGVTFSENAQAVLDELETYYAYVEDYDTYYFIFTIADPLERGETAWVRYEVSSDKYKPFGLVLYFTVPKLERNDASYNVNIDVFSQDSSEKSVTLSQLLDGKNIPQSNVQVSENASSDNLFSVVTGLRYEDNTLFYTPADSVTEGTTADIEFRISSSDYEDFFVTVFFNVIDGRLTHKNVSKSVSIPYTNTDTSVKLLTTADIFGGADKLPEGLHLDTDAMTVTGNTAAVFSELSVSGNGIEYAVLENPAEGAKINLEIPASADGYKDFTVKVSFNVSSKVRGPYAFVVHFETNGGSKIENKVVNRGKRLPMPALPTKDGFVFGGWYTDAELEKEYDFTRSVGRNFTLYAKWTPVTVQETDNEDTTAEDAVTEDAVTEDNTAEDAEQTEYKIIFTIDKKEANIFGTEKVYDVAPVIVNGRTMLSARYVAENLGATVDWDPTAGNGKVTITKGNTEIVLYIGEMYADVNGSRTELDVVPFIENNRTYYPARFIAERLGATVSWNETSHTVTVTTTEKPLWNENFNN